MTYDISITILYKTNKDKKHQKNKANSPLEGGLGGVGQYQTNQHLPAQA